VDNVDLRLLDRFRIAQRLNRGGDELQALERLLVQVETRPANVGGVTRLADVIEFRPRD
jgi:hypothetical protein